MSASRIRVGLVGLSAASGGVNWAGTAHLPYLTSSHGKERFEIVALCNSSVESGKKSIEHYKLPSSIKTYASSAELAADSNVDLVVNVTGVEMHYEVLKPVVKAGKSVFTELPLASNMQQMQELLKGVTDGKVDNVFGMQGQTSPVVRLLKDTIASGKIGKVLSSTWTGFGSFFGGEKPVPLGVKYFTDRKSGGNLMSVGFLHTMNYIIATLGDIDTFQSMLGNQRPSVTIIDPKQSGKVVETVQKDTPDQVFFQGRLKSKALISYHLRGGNPFPGQKEVTWLIYGEKGEIMITNPAFMLDIDHSGIEIKLQVFGKEGGEEPELLELPKDDLSEIKQPAQNVGRIYNAYAKGQKGGEGGYPDWQEGMKRHLLIEEMWKRADGQNAFGW